MELILRSWTKYPDRSGSVGWEEHCFKKNHAARFPPSSCERHSRCKQLGSPVQNFGSRRATQFSFKHSAKSLSFNKTKKPSNKCTNLIAECKSEVASAISLNAIFRYPKTPLWELLTTLQNDIQYSCGKITLIPNKGNSHFCAISLVGNLVRVLCSLSLQTC